MLVQYLMLVYILRQDVVGYNYVLSVLNDLRLIFLKVNYLNIMTDLKVKLEQQQTLVLLFRYKSLV